MCDYSLHSVKTRPAKVGDKLTTRVFNFSTRGFCAPEDVHVAVCVLPGTELSFIDEVRRTRPWPWTKSIHHKTAISVRSIWITSTPIMMPWNFLMARSCC